MMGNALAVSNTAITTTPRILHEYQEKSIGNWSAKIGREQSCFEGSSGSEKIIQKMICIEQSIASVTGSCFRISTLSLLKSDNIN